MPSHSFALSCSPRCCALAATSSRSGVPSLSLPGDFDDSVGSACDAAVAIAAAGVPCAFAPCDVSSRKRIRTLGDRASRQLESPSSSGLPHR
eukprot:419441-Rhodomonas_salina.1